jgi:hypothetical protein
MPLQHNPTPQTPRSMRAPTTTSTNSQNVRSQNFHERVRFTEKQYPSCATNTARHSMNNRCPTHSRQPLLLTPTPWIPPRAPVTQSRQPLLPTPTPWMPRQAPIRQSRRPLLPTPTHVQPRTHLPPWSGPWVDRPPTLQPLEPLPPRPSHTLTPAHHTASSSKSPMQHPYHS